MQAPARQHWTALDSIGQYWTALDSTLASRPTCMIPAQPDNARPCHPAPTPRPQAPARQHQHAAQPAGLDGTVPFRKKNLFRFYKKTFQPANVSIITLFTSGMGFFPERSTKNILPGAEGAGEKWVSPPGIIVLLKGWHCRNSF
jgi:hypothetical protein